MWGVTEREREMMESSFGSSSGGRMRILEVSIQSASFSKDVTIHHSGSEIYAKIWIKGSNEQRKFKTGNLLLASASSQGPRNSSATTNYAIRKDHEFVFAVAPSFFVNDNNTSNNSSVCFEIYRTRKHLRNKLLG